MDTKESYKDNPFIDTRTHVRFGEEDEIAIKPYYYYRSGALHIRYSVDRCIELSPSEQAGLKVNIASTYDKQTVLAKAWNFFTTCVKKEVIRDGIAYIDKRIKESNKEYESGR